MATKEKTRKPKRAGYNRRYNTPFPWGLHYKSWCYKCRREIREYDLVEMGTYYDGNERIDSFVHVYCDDHRDRPRVPRPESTVHTNSEGITRVSYTMATKTKRSKSSKTKKSRKQKAAEEEDEDTTTAVADTEDEEIEDQDEGEDEEEEAPKSKKTKKSKGEKKPRDGSTFIQTTGERLVPLLEGAPKKLRVIATNMSKNKDVSHEELVTMKEGIKEFAAKQREEGGDESVASQLSALNSRVRRLERDAR